MSMAHMQLSEARISKTVVAPASGCAHCGLSIPSGVTGQFCCRGCEMVYSLLQERGLGDYYLLREKGRMLRKNGPAPAPSLSSDMQSHLDDPEFLELYATAEGQVRSMQFYLEGVHCTACVWLAEKTAEWVEGVISIRLDLGHSLATVKIGPNGSFSRVAREFARLGYRPHPVRQDEAWVRQARENRSALIRMAVSAAGAGNIMLLAVAVYAGAEGSFARHFEWISFALCLPVATYGAWPFYRSAWIALRSRQLSIDIPIALGMIVGFGASIVSLFFRSKHVYFDTVSALIFLLLASRYLLRKTQQEAMHASRLIHFLTPSLVRKKIQEGESVVYQEVKAEQIRSGDEVLVLAGECIPVDGIVRDGNSSLNIALMTGESRHERVGAGSLVFAGTMNHQAPIKIEATAEVSATRLARILSSVEEQISRKAPIVAFTDSIAKKFVLVSLGLVGVAFLIGWSVSPDEAVSRALAMAIVACPCAFAFATPLAMSVAMGRSAKNGVLIKGADVLEKLAHVDQVVLDKTGTLTAGEFEVQSWIHDSDAPEAARAVYALESRSMHPIAKAMVVYLRAIVTDEQSVEIGDFEEKIGRGVSGSLFGHRYEIRSWGESSGSSIEGSTIAVIRDGKIVARAVLGDRLRDDAVQAVDRLRAMGLRIGILSGDGRSAVQRVARQLGVLPRDAISGASPEAKSALVKPLPRALMVGDGANDAIALASAYVSVAVHGGLEISMRSADVYHCVPGILPVAQLIELARETMKVIHRNFAFSLVYNAIGTWAALTGRVDPLFAAVLMPASALTVFFSSIAGTRRLRHAFETEERR